MLTDDDVRVNLAANLKRMLAERDISQAELGRLTGVTQANISLICAGKHVSGVGVLARIAEALDTSIDFLIASPKPSSKKSLAHAS